MAMAAGARNGSGLGSRSRLALWGGSAALMFVPVVVIRAGQAAPSDPGDYIFLAVLLALLGLAYELAARVPDRLAFRAAAAIWLAAGFLQTWVSLAVGIIGSEDNPANWIYAAVIAVAVAGALVAGPRPLSLARAMSAAAAAQVLAFAVALAAGLGFTGPVTVLFTGLWMISAWLFRRAACTDRAALPEAEAK